MMMTVEYYVKHRLNREEGYVTWTLDYSRYSDLDDSTGYWYMYPSPDNPGKTRVEYTIDVRISGWVTKFIQTTLIPQPRTHQFLYHGVFASNAKYRKEILPKYRRVRAKPKWKKLSRKDGIKSQHVAWAQLLWRSFGVMGFVCQHCGCLMRLRAVAIYPPATTKILRGLGVNLHGLGFTGPP